MNDPRKVPIETWDDYGQYTAEIKKACVRWRFPFTECPPMVIYVWWSLSVEPDDVIERLRTGKPYKPKV